MWWSVVRASFIDLGFENCYNHFVILVCIYLFVYFILRMPHLLLAMHYLITYYSNSKTFMHIPMQAISCQIKSLLLSER